MAKKQVCGAEVKYRERACQDGAGASGCGSEILFAVGWRG